MLFACSSISGPVSLLLFAAKIALLLAVSFVITSGVLYVRLSMLLTVFICLYIPELSVVVAHKLSSAVLPEIVGVRR